MAIEQGIEKLIRAVIGSHDERVREQQVDQEYYDDKFKTRIASPFHVIRTGSAARVVDNIVAHIETAKPQVFREPKKTTLGARESAVKVSRYLNYLANIISPEITEAVFNMVLRGESIFQVEYNPSSYEKDGKDWKHIMGREPIIITSPDPLITFCYPYDSLLPEKVVKRFSIDTVLAGDMVRTFADKEYNFRGNSVEYTSYFSPDRIYSTAGSQQVRNQKNVLGFTPFVHCYSGFGKRSPDGKPETMAVGKLRKIRGRLLQECELESRIDSIVALYANPLVVINQLTPDASAVDEEELQEIVLGPGGRVGGKYGYKFEIYTPNVNISQLISELAVCKQAIGLEDPPLMSGIASSSRTSGRQEDVEFGHIQSKYSTLIDNLERALEQALGMALRILYESPQALPITFRGEVVDGKGKSISDQVIDKDDIDGYYDCKVKLNPDETLQDNINFQKYRILRNERHISELEFQTKGLKKTEHEAIDSIAEALAEDAVMTDPVMRQIRVQEAAERMGMSRYFQQASKDAQLGERMNKALQEQPGNYRPSEATNPMAADILRQSMNEAPKPTRRSPSG